MKKQGGQSAPRRETTPKEPPPLVGTRHLTNPRTNDPREEPARSHSWGSLEAHQRQSKNNLVWFTGDPCHLQFVLPNSIDQVILTPIKLKQVQNILLIDPLPTCSCRCFHSLLRSILIWFQIFALVAWVDTLVFRMTSWFRVNHMFQRAVARRDCHHFFGACSCNGSLIIIYMDDSRMGLGSHDMWGGFS